MIAGSPEGVEAAAWALRGHGTGLREAGVSLGAHGRAITSAWSGNASDAAYERFAFLASRTVIGGEVALDAVPVLFEFAGELRAAQQLYEAGAAAAGTAEGAVRAADQAAAAAAAGGLVDVAGERAGASARAELSAAHHEMTAAVARADRANAHAAGRIVALTAELDQMRAERLPAAPAPVRKSVQGSEAEGDQRLREAAEFLARNFHDGPGSVQHNMRAGAGSALCDIGPGAVTGLVGMIPWGPTRAVGEWGEDSKEWLAETYGADQDSRAYRYTETTTNVGSVFIGGAGAVRGAVRAAPRAWNAAKGLLAGGGISSVTAAGVAAKFTAAVSAIAKAIRSTLAKASTRISSGVATLGLYLKLIRGGSFKRDLASDATGATDDAVELALPGGPGGQAPKPSPSAGTEGERFGPHSPGPLTPTVAATFRGGSYSATVLKTDIIVYRSFGGGAKPVGSYWSRIKPTGPLQAQIDSALNPAWGTQPRERFLRESPQGRRSSRARLSSNH